MDRVPSREGTPAQGQGDAESFGTGAARQANRNRQELLNRIFDHVDEVRAAERKLVRQEFGSGQAPRAEPHSPLLQKVGAEPEGGLTLRERLRKILGG